MRSNIRKNTTQSRDVILSGKGDQYSDVSKEMEQILHQWMSQSGLAESSFDHQLQPPYTIIESETQDGDKEVRICSDNIGIGLPFVWQHDGDVPLEDFYTNLVLLFFLIAARPGKSAFEPVIREYSEKIISKIP